jgi:hypothetical protein
VGTQRLLLLGRKRGLTCKVMLGQFILIHLLSVGTSTYFNNECALQSLCFHVLALAVAQSLYSHVERPVRSLY